MKKHTSILTGIIICFIAVMMLVAMRQSTQPKTMPLVPMMQLLLTDMQRADQGIYTENYTMIEEGGRSIADHPVMTEADKKLVKSTLGEEMKIPWKTCQA